METEYWEISDYRKTKINLFEEGEKIYSSKLTKKQVEKKLGINLDVAGRYDNPAIIVHAMVNFDGKKHYDRRKKRGITVRYYIVK